MERTPSARTIAAVLASVSVLAGMVASEAPASGVTVTKLSTVTPFADDCGDLNDGGIVPGPAPTAVADFEAEPHLAVDPTDPDHLVATWQQDRYAAFGGARSLLVTSSRDGGGTWTPPATIPNLSGCTGGQRSRASDPWVAIGADGAAYLAGMPLTEDVSSARLTFDFDGDIAVSRSSDGGDIWEPASLVVADEGVFWEEKPVMAADPSVAGRIFVAWARHLNLDPALSVPAGPADVAMAFSRSDDGGGSWSLPSVIGVDTPHVVDWPWAILAVQDEERTRLVVLGIQTPNRLLLVPYSIVAVSSDDLGQTWSVPVLVDAVADSQTFPSAAVGPDGAIWITWADRVSGGSDIKIARSDDLGESWSTNLMASFSHDAFIPTMAVAGDGRPGVMWFDGRNEDGAAGRATDVYLASSSDGGSTWDEMRIAGPFDLDEATVGDRRFLGEYVGAVGLPEGFALLFPMARPMATDGPTDIFFARVTHP